VQWAPPLRLVDGAWTEVGDAATSPVDVSLVTWNAWFGEHMFDVRRRALLDTLSRRRPDVIALQEVTPPLLDDLSDEPWLRSSYRFSNVQQLQTYDVVLLSRLPVVRVGTLALPSEMGRRLVVAELACGLAVATVHLESMKGYARSRAAQLAIINPVLGPDAVLVGDMNFQPGDPLETAAIDPSFVDAWPVLHPHEPGFTVDAERNAMRFMAEGSLSRKRIDRVFVRGRRWRATAIELIGTTPIDGDGTHVSDHFGLAATLTVAG
jgi:tyrosyl-DNA phosphodiesterase 2